MMALSKGKLFLYAYFLALAGILSLPSMASNLCTSVAINDNASLYLPNSRLESDSGPISTSVASSSHQGVKWARPLELASASKYTQNRARGTSIVLSPYMNRVVIEFKKNPSLIRRFPHFALMLYWLSNRDIFFEPRFRPRYPYGVHDDLEYLSKLDHPFRWAFPAVQESFLQIVRGSVEPPLKKEFEKNPEDSIGKVLKNPGWSEALNSKFQDWDPSQMTKFFFVAIYMMPEVARDRNIRYNQSWARLNLRWEIAEFQSLAFNSKLLSNGKSVGFPDYLDTEKKNILSVAFDKHKLQKSSHMNGYYGHAFSGLTLGQILPLEKERVHQFWSVFLADWLYSDRSFR